VTISITKKPGENAIDVADAVMQRVDVLRNTVIPADVEVAETRNYGATANDKAQKLIQKLLFATAAVVALVFIALGRREAAIVGSAVILTLTVTLFAVLGLGLHAEPGVAVRADLLDRHPGRRRHRGGGEHPPPPGAASGKAALAELIPGAVDEVGGPTILATLTVIAALLPMAFVSGLMGPYMSPIPINASMGMLLSLAIAFVVTPWLARIWMKATPAQHAGAHAGCRRASPAGCSRASSARCWTRSAARATAAARAGRAGADRCLGRAAGAGAGAC
jgi:multidrug efflux pump subunit AcrB